MTATLLVPVDFSDCSGLVAQRALERAKAEGAQVVFLHVAQPPPGISPEVRISPDGGALTTVGGHMVKEAEEKLAPFLRLAESEGVKATVQVREGAPAANIVRAALDYGAEAIVMGTHGRTGLARLLLGSVAAKVQKEAPIPVETVKAVHREDCKAASCNWCMEQGLWRGHEEVVVPEG